MPLFPGVSWVDMHSLANRVMLSELAAGGLLRGDVDDMLQVSAPLVIRALSLLGLVYRF